MHDTKERLSLLWIFALLNYLYADVVALFAIAPALSLSFGHKDVKTTMICTHVLNKGGWGVKSPADSL